MSKRKNFAQRLANRLNEKFSPRPTEVDTTRFNDEIANITAWSPMKGGGSNFSTHKLVIDSDSRMEFVASNQGVIFALVFILAGAGVFIFGFAGQTVGGNICMGLFGLPFLAIGVFLFRSSIQPIVFDKKQDRFWIGFDPSNIPDNKTSCSLNRVHAIQLIEEWNSGSDSAYFSYELNLVLKTGERIHVVDHGDSNQMRVDAQVLGEFLNVPIWDIISGTGSSSRGKGFVFKR